MAAVFCKPLESDLNHINDHLIHLNHISSHLIHLYDTLCYGEYLQIYMVYLPF